jgi:hypothetical protein
MGDLPLASCGALIAPWSVSCFAAIAGWCLAGEGSRLSLCAVRSNGSVTCLCDRAVEDAVEGALECLVGIDVASVSDVLGDCGVVAALEDPLESRVWRQKRGAPANAAPPCFRSRASAATTTVGRSRGRTSKEACAGTTSRRRPFGRMRKCAAARSQPDPDDRNSPRNSPGSPTGSVVSSLPDRAILCF